MVDYKKLFVVVAVFIAIVFSSIELYVLSQDVAEFNSRSKNEVDKTLKIMDEDMGLS